jgi:hypothetical protein
VALLRENRPPLASPWLTLYTDLGLALGLAERGLLERARAMRDGSASLVHRTLRAAHLGGSPPANASECAARVPAAGWLERETRGMAGPTEDLLPDLDQGRHPASQLH